MATTPNFDTLSNFNKDAGVVSVRYGANAQVLQVELNEMQQAIHQRMTDMMKLVYSNGLSRLDACAYSGTTFTISNVYALINGVLIYVSSLTKTAANGTQLYLDTWVSDIAFDGTLYKYGNTQETAVTNYIMDADAGIETSRRRVRNYTIATATGVANHDYLLLGTIINGSFVASATLIRPVFGDLEDKFISTANQTVFTLTKGAYTPGTGRMKLYINGMRVSKDAFIETSSTVVTLKASLPAGYEVLLIY